MSGKHCLSRAFTMRLFKRTSWADCVLLGMIVCVCWHAKSVEATVGKIRNEETPCPKFRRELSLLLRRAYAESSYPAVGGEIFQRLVEAFMPYYCSQEPNDTTSHSSRHQYSAHDRSAKAFRLNELERIKEKRRQKLEKNINQEDVRIPKEDIAAGETAIPNSSVRKQGHVKHGSSSNRMKRFVINDVLGPFELRRMSRNKFISDKARQFNQLAQMVDYFIKRKYPRFATLSFSNGTPRWQSRNVNDKTNLGVTAYDNIYHMRGKRETKVDKLAAIRRRTKRFLFGEAAEQPSMLSIMMGTATDPNTGKRVEFGGDVMKNMMVNTFTSFLPPFAQPPPGKEPNELVKAMAPMWYFSSMQQLMSPPARSQVRSQARATDRKQNTNGYYGDRVPGKR